MRGAESLPGTSAGRDDLASPFDPPPRPVAGGRIAGGWKLSTDDRRFGGLSALAVDQGRFVALSDAGGGAVRRPAARPAARGNRRPPGRPGPATLKSSRDSEAIVARSGGRLVGRVRDSPLDLVLRHDFRAARGRSGGPGLAENAGIEDCRRGRRAAGASRRGRRRRLAWKPRPSRCRGARAGGMSPTLRIPDGALSRCAGSFRGARRATRANSDGQRPGRADRASRGR